MLGFLYQIRDKNVLVHFGFLLFLYHKHKKEKYLWVEAGFKWFWLSVSRCLDRALIMQGYMHICSADVFEHLGLCEYSR